MDEKKKNEVLAFAWFALATLTLLSLLSYTPDDIPFEVSTPNSPMRNFVGPFGAYTAWSLRILFGKTSYFLVPLFLCWSLAKWSGKEDQRFWLRIFSIAIFLSSSCALFSLFGAPITAPGLSAAADELVRFQRGGILGYFSSHFLSNVFGHAGIFVALSLFILSVILATELLILQIATQLFTKIKNHFAVRALKKELPAAAVPKKPVIRPEIAVKKEIPELSPAKPEIRMSVPKPVPPAAKIEKPVVKGPSVVIPIEKAGDYQLPPLSLLENRPIMDQTETRSSLEASSRVLEDTLRDFGIEAKVVEVEQGPTITRYELQPAAGVKVQRITSLENDIALVMSAASVRIIAPIPGKSRVGIEVPNRAASIVSLKEVIQSQEYQNERSPVSIVIGKDTAGSPLVCDLSAMPHLLIAGATNTGKSVCINSIIMSILFRSSPEQVKFLIVDPKMVELHFYNDLPHLICPVVTDKSKTPGALAWLVGEMDRRYKVLSRVGAKNLVSFNEKVENKQITGASLRAPEAGNDEDAMTLMMAKSKGHADSKHPDMSMTEEEAKAFISSHWVKA